LFAENNKNQEINSRPAGETWLVFTVIKSILQNLFPIKKRTVHSCVSASKDDVWYQRPLKDIIPAISVGQWNFYRRQAYPGDNIRQSGTCFQESNKKLLECHAPQKHDVCRFDLVRGIFALFIKST